MPPPDAADGDAPFEIVRIPGRGYGTRARRALRAGTVILREAPIAVLKAASLHEWLQRDQQLRALAQAAQQEDTWSSPFSDAQYWPSARPASAEVVRRFAELEFANLPPENQQRWMSLVDSFSSAGAAKTPGDVLRSNAFTHPASGDNRLYEVLSRFNHGCAPSVCREFLGEMAVVTTLRDVAAGEELLISYLADGELARPTANRRATLRSKFNFVCECDRCGTVQAAAPPASADVCHPATATRAAQETRPPYDDAMRALNERLLARTAELAGAAAPTAAKALMAVRECAEAIEQTARARAGALHGVRQHAPV